MIAIACNHDTQVRCGKDRKGNQRFLCKGCGKYLLADTPKPLGEMRISMKQTTMALGMILEGMSIRATERLTGLHRDTIDDLILTVGENCQRFLEAKVKDVPVTDVQVDEIWGFVFCKEKTRVAHGYSEECGDTWTFTAIERNTKLILAHEVGRRDNDTCWRFLSKLAKATGGRFQLTSDGLKVYTLNVPFIFGGRVDFAQLIKTYSSTQETTRYSPAKIESVERLPQMGDCEWDRICTSHVERHNLTIRMNNRRFTRLTNAHSKSHKHHVAMQAIFMAWYNFCRKHETLRGKTPAMATGLADEPWSVAQVLENAASC